LATDITTRLKRGDTLVLDGATKTELRRRGVTDTLKGQELQRKGASFKPTTANIDAPERVQELHEDYVRAGADIITTNTFNSSPSKIRLRGMAHLADRFEEINRVAVEIAMRARAASNPKSYVAGSIPPPLREIDEARKAIDVADQARVLAASGVDLIMLEYNGSVRECVTALTAVAALKLDLPVFLGIRKATADGSLSTGESFQELASAIKGLPVDAVLVMCSLPDNTSAALQLLRNAYSGPIGAYPNAEHDDNYTPPVHSRYAREWLSMGAQIVGGCCGTTPEHIAALRPVLKPVAI